MIGIQDSKWQRYIIGFAGLAAVALSGPTHASGEGSRLLFTGAVPGISVTATHSTLGIGKTQALSVSVHSGGHVVGSPAVVWQSSNPKVASVNRTTGVVTGVSTGKVTILAHWHAATGSVTLQVLNPGAVHGVAAQGAAVTSAQVTLVDAKGKTLTTTTGGDGSYSFDTSGLTPPYLVAVQTGPHTVLYSVSADANASSTINVTPLTDLIIRSWYSVQGVDVGTAFTAPATNPPPSPSSVQLISNVVVNVTALWLQENGVDTTTFSPISTGFAANGTGVDAVLADTSINTGTGAITITDGTTTQNSTVTYDTETGSVSIATTTDGPSGDSSSVTGTVVATSTPMQTAVDDITTTLDSFTSTVNTKGTALANTDLTSFLDTNLLDEGLNKAQFADSVADQFRGLTLAFQISNINSLDTTNGLADVTFTASVSKDAQTQTDTIEFFFKKQGDGSWLFYGNQLPAKLGVQSEARTNQGAFTGDDGPDINVDIRPIEGAYSGISIDDNGFGVFTNTALTQDGIEADVFTPNLATPGTKVTIDRDEFFANSGVLKSLVPAGTPITVTMTPASGPAQQFTVKTNAFTTETISITNLPNSAIADANLGSPLHVEWTLPTTFAIARVKLSGTVFDGDQTKNTTTSCQVDGLILSINSTSADITLPTTVCGSNGATVQANLNLNVTGVNGEQSNVIFQFQ